MVRATIGIDVGTSAVKVLVLGEGGNVLAESSRSYPTRSPRPGWMEQAPEDWWRATCAALHEATQATEAELAGIGLSGQLNGMVLLDPDDKPIGDAIIWLDTRAVAEAEELKGRFRDLLLSRAATDLSPIALLPKFAWLARNEPARLARARSVLMVKDYLLWRLTGVVATDPSDAAATGMMDVETQVWIPELCAAAGLDPTVLPPIVPSMAIVGHVTAAAAAATGLPEDLPVVPGGGDVAALTVGCGVSKPGVVGITLGTAGHVVLAVDRAAPFAPSTAIWRLPHADPVHAIWLGLVMSGGLSLAWLHHVLSGANHALPFETMTALSNSARPGAGGVSFVPFLEGAATPYGEPLARGTFTGLSSSTTSAEMVQAVMEGVTFNVLECIELFEARGSAISEVRVAEGGARVDRWCQIIADVLQRPVVRVDCLNASSLGAALMAQAGIDGGGLTELSSTLVRKGKEFAPHAKVAATYTEAYRAYKAAAASEIMRVRALSNQTSAEAR